jgi:hypothetical protein
MPCARGPKKSFRNSAEIREVSPDLPTMVEAGFPGSEAPLWAKVIKASGAKLAD